MNIFDYIDTVQHENIYDRDFTELDFLILSELSYLHHDHLIHSNLQPETGLRLSELDQLMSDELSTIVSKQRRQLLRKIAQTKRYKNIKAFAYVNEIDLDSQMQFSALIFRIKQHTYVVTFRGTDDSIVGWKEDFHMTYMNKVPAQITATNYLKQALATLDGTFILSGHSKGGNLAIYSASHIPSPLQERITAIYSFDAPGLNKETIQKEGYQAILPIVKRYIPQGSIVGMMLEVPKQVQIVQSTALGGVAQHNTFSWQIETDHFCYLDELNPDSLQMDQTLKEWTATLSDQELQEFFDLFFNLILDAGVHSIDEFFDREGLKKISTIIDNARSLSHQQKELFNRLTKLLFTIRYQTWLEHFNLPDFSDKKGAFQLDFPNLPFSNSSSDKN